MEEFCRRRAALLRLANSWKPRYRTIAGAISAGGGIGFTARSDASASGMLTLTGSLAYGLQPVQQADSKMISIDASSVNSVYTTALEPQIPATLCLVAIRY